MVRKGGHESILFGLGGSLDLGLLGRFILGLPCASASLFAMAVGGGLFYIGGYDAFQEFSRISSNQCVLCQNNHELASCLKKC